MALKSRVAVACCIVAGLALLARAVAADDFRVETEIFVEKQTQPVSENLTLFQGDVTYDFEITEPQKITIFDTARGQIVMLDPARQMRTTVAKDELLHFVAELQIRAREGKSRLKFLADPNFTPSFEASTAKLTLASDVLTYSVKGVAAKDPSAVLRYREFADWSARLNSTRPDSLLPFARMLLNKSLAEKSLIPSEVELTLTPESQLTGKKVTLKSKQTFTWRLLESDQQKISRAASQSTEFKAVRLEEFREFSKLADKRAK